MRVKAFRLSRAYNGAWELSAEVYGDSVKEAMNLCDKQKDRLYEMTIKEYREKRSLTANAYFHVLCTKIAAEMQTDIDSVKRMLVKRYGSAAIVNGSPVTITIPKGVLAETYYPYCEWLNGDANGDTYLLMKQTHVMDTKEFARLIDGTVDEAKALGIETLPDEELERLYAISDEKQSSASV